MEEKRDDFVGFAFAEDGDTKRDAENELFKVGEGRGLWRRG